METIASVIQSYVSTNGLVFDSTCGSVSVRDHILYSYAEPICQIIQESPIGAYALLVSTQFSRTTSKHVSLASNALIRHLPLNPAFYVPFPRNRPTDVSHNANHLHESAEGHLATITNKRCSMNTRIIGCQQYEHAAMRHDQYCEANNFVHTPVLPLSLALPPEVMALMILNGFR
jgi:hypothetical protein